MALLVGCMDPSSIGGLHGVSFYWWVVWDIDLLVAVWGI